MDIGRVHKIGLGYLDIVNATAFDADNSYIGQKEVRLKPKLVGSKFRVQGSAWPPAKTTAGLINKETDERRTSNVQSRHGHGNGVKRPIWSPEPGFFAFSYELQRSAKVDNHPTIA
jgi:hypothetical protein